MSKPKGSEPSSADLKKLKKELTGGSAEAEAAVKAVEQEFTRLGKLLNDDQKKALLTKIAKSTPDFSVLPKNTLKHIEKPAATKEYKKLLKRVAKKLK